MKGCICDEQGQCAHHASLRAIEEGPLAAKLREEITRLTRERDEARASERMAWGKVQEWQSAAGRATRDRLTAEARVREVEGLALREGKRNMAARARIAELEGALREMEARIRREHAPDNCDHCSATMDGRTAATSDVCLDCWNAARACNAELERTLRDGLAVFNAYVGRGTAFYVEQWADRARTLLTPTPPAAGAGDFPWPLSLRRVPLWSAINRYTEACGGDTSEATVGNARMDAVAAVERELNALLPTPTTPAPEQAGEGERCRFCRHTKAEHNRDTIGLGIPAGCRSCLCVTFLEPTKEGGRDA